MKTHYAILLTYVVFITSGCNDASKNGNLTIEGKKPVYSKDLQWTTIEVRPAEQAQHLGKIVTYNNYIFLVDINKGVHIVNNSTPSSPQKIAFLSIPLCTDIAIKNNYLYANNGADMIVMNIANPAQAQLEKRVENVYSNLTELSPAGYSGYFECVDETQGRVIGWIDTVLVNPKCRK